MKPAPGLEKWDKLIVLFSIFIASQIPSHVHVNPGYREKSADLQGTLKLHMRFYNRIYQGHRDPRNEN